MTLNETDKKHESVNKKLLENIGQVIEKMAINDMLKKEKRARSPALNEVRIGSRMYVLREDGKLVKKEKG